MSCFFTALVILPWTRFMCVLLILTTTHKNTISQKNFFAECPPLDSDVKEGDSLVLKCQQIEGPDFIYIWADSDLPESEFNPSPWRNYSTYGPLGQLTIRKTDHYRDNGRYSCQAHPTNTSDNQHVQQCTAAKVMVHYVEPDIKVERIDNAPSKPNTVELRCNVDASPQPTIYWYHNDKQVTPNSSISQSVQMSGKVLTLNGIREAAVGTYFCKLKSGILGEFLSQVAYVLHYTGTNSAKFFAASSKTAVQYVKSNDKVMLSCASSDSTWRPRWKFFQKFSDNNAPVAGLPEGVAILGNGSVAIESYNSRMRGFYLCLLTKASEKRRSIKFLYQLITAENHRLDDEKNFEPPIRQEKSFVIREGSNFTLRVYVNFGVQDNGVVNWAPIPTLQWKNPNGKLLTNKGGVRVIRKRFLFFNSAKRDHSGTYTLELRNMAGVKRNQAKIIVAFPPRMSNTLEKKTAEENSTISFICPIDENNCNIFPISTISWQRNNDTHNITIMKSHENIRFVVSQDGRHLTINNVQMSDAGKYQCIVTTTFDAEEDGRLHPAFSAKSNFASLHVTKKLKWTQAPTNYFEVGKQGVLTCAAEGETELFWNFFKFEKGRNVKLENVASSLIVNNVTYQNHGIYECNVRDFKGNSLTKKVALTVGVKPSVIMTSKNASISVGASELFDCKGEGSTIQPDGNSAHLTVSWLFKPSSSATVVSITAEKYGSEITADDGSYVFQRLTQVPNIKLFANGSLKIMYMESGHVGAYRCLVSNNFTLAYSSWIHLTLKGSLGLADMNQESDLLRTVLIVVGCAMVYISSVIILTVYCSVRMWRKKAKRVELNMLQLSPDSYRLVEQTGRKRDPIPPLTVTGSVSRSSTSQPSNKIVSGDAQSCISIGSATSSGLTYGISIGAGTPANSTVESTVERLCHTYQRDRLRDMVMQKGLLGRGLFGEVKLATTSKFGHFAKESLVFVKHLTNRDATNITEFINQIKMFAKLDHEHVTKLMGVCTEENQPPLLIMEYCEHGNLFEFLKSMRDNYGQSSLHADNQIRMCLQIAQAMEHIHSLGQTHGDLAAHNVLVTRDCNLKVTHLGPCLDRFVGHYYGPIRKHQLLPIRWLPPEVILHDFWSAHTDAWSYAILVTEIFNYGQLPYANFTDSMLMEAVNRGSLLPQEPASSWLCPHEIVQLLQLCWQEKPSLRPSFQQLCLNVAKLMGGVDEL